MLKNPTALGGHVRPVSEAAAHAQNRQMPQASDNVQRDAGGHGGSPPIDIE